jgi:hypothetical protein
MPETIIGCYREIERYSGMQECQQRMERQRDFCGDCARDKHPGDCRAWQKVMKAVRFSREDMENQIAEVRPQPRPDIHDEIMSEFGMQATIDRWDGGEPGLSFRVNAANVKGD